MPTTAAMPVYSARGALTEGPVMMQRVKVAESLPDLPGSGPYAAGYAEADGAKFTVYAPTDLAAAASVRKLPIYIFGNGGCSYDGAAQRFHLTDIASYGYIAITPGEIQSGPKAPPKAPPKAMPPGPPPSPDQIMAEMMKAPRQTPEMLNAAIDWIIAENGRSGSPYYGKIDTSRIAVAGGSCGGLLAMATALQPRVKSLTMFDSGVFPVRRSMLAGMAPAMRSMMTVTKDDLDQVHTPVLYMTGGKDDLAYAMANDDFAKISKAPVFMADRPNTGHLGMAFEPNAEGTKIEVHWLEYTLFGDRRAALMFEGKDCSLCRDIVWKVSKKGMK